MHETEAYVKLASNTITAVSESILGVNVEMIGLTWRTGNNTNYH